ncbi:YecA family protein [Aestuariibacter halophilus]|uniref:YecA family protein n=1 Tax=Fluctibacter halophilus TaxID=226011 RepID=A0ABS8G9Z4_9ALTE|nr:UPF0149 family protein [Aestuariibacter halophilus]MCC2617269.1 YecA family protein [Aestuariibacter halophilus]
MHTPPEWYASLSELTCGPLANIVHPTDHVAGLVCFVASAPEIPMPDQWLPWSLAVHGQLPDQTQADALADVLMKGLQQQLAAMRSGDPLLPGGYECPAIDQADAPVSLWLTGGLAAHKQLENTWQHAWQRMQHKDPHKAPDAAKTLKHCLRLFSTFANVPLAVAQAREAGNQQLVTALPSIFNGLEPALQAYVSLAGQLSGYLPNQFETFVQD